MVTGVLGMVIAPQTIVFDFATATTRHRAMRMAWRGAALAACTWILLAAIVATIEAIGGGA